MLNHFRTVLMTEIILIERDNNIATVTLNRPEKLNALSKALWRRVGEVMEDLSDDESLRCVVLRGAGDKAFSPGADISEFPTERANLEQAREYGRWMHFTMAAIRDCL